MKKQVTIIGLLSLMFIAILTDGSQSTEKDTPSISNVDLATQTNQLISQHDNKETKH